MRNVWTDDEISKLEETYLKYNKEQLIELFPRHTWNSIKSRARVKHGLLRPDWRNYTKVFLDFSIIDTQEKAYILGLWAADGCISKVGTENMITIGLKNEKDLLTQVANLLGDVSVNYNPKRNNYRISIKNKSLANQFISHGVVPKKSYNLKPPIDIPSNLMHHWIRGYFDGDGALYISNNNLQLCFTGTYLIINFIIEWFKEHFSIYKGKPHQKNNSPTTFDAKFSGELAIEFTRMMYKDATIFMYRKHKVFIYWLKTTGKDL